MTRGVVRRARRVRVPVTLAVAVSVLAAVLFSLNGEYQQGAARLTEQAARPVVLDVALVNEDRGVDAGGEPVNLGRGYVKQIESDTSAVWHVVSRGVADRGLTYGNYHLAVIIPAEFSEKLLDLEAVDPSPIGITYQVNGGGNARVEAVADQRGREIVSGLNGQLVDMYVASILGNLRQAQDNVRLVVDAEAEHAGVFVDEVDPATRGLGVGLGALTQGADGSLGANASLLDGLGALDGELSGSAVDLAAHVQSLSDLLAARQAGTLTYGAFLESLLATDAQLLGDGVQHLHDELVDVGGALAERLVEDGAGSNAAAVAELQALVDESAAAVDGRRTALQALAAEPALAAGYSAGVHAALGWGTDGVVLEEVLASASNGQAAADVEMVGLLRATTEAQISTLPYRTQVMLRVAEDRGLFGHGGADLAGALESVREDLDTVLTWLDGTTVPDHPDGVVGGDLRDLVTDLVTAQHGQPDPVTGEPTEPVDVDALSTAALRYAARITQVVDAYDRAAALVGLVESCATTCGLRADVDATAVVDQVITAAVQQQIALEEEHLDGSVLLTGELQGASVALAEIQEQLRASTRTLSENIAGQLDSLDSLRTSMAQVRDDERTAARSVAESDTTTRTIMSEAQALATASEAVLLSSQSGTEQAGRITELLDGLRADVTGLLGDSADLDARSGRLTTALTGQVEGSQAFAESFGGVLANAHSAGVLNERLLEFLVAPVAPSQRASVASADVTRPFPWVLIAFSLCFTAAYLLGSGRSEQRQRSAFDRGRAEWLRVNLRALRLPALAGVVVGAGVAWASGADLGVPREQQIAWGATVVLICLALTLVAHWLVRQWRMVGAGLCVVLLVGYVFVSDAVGTGVTSGFSGVVAATSPLYHAETAMSGVLGADTGGLAAVVPLLGWVVGAAVLDLLVQDDVRRLVPRRWRTVPA